jgi:hypothetical protein
VYTHGGFFSGVWIYFCCTAIKKEKLQIKSSKQNQQQHNCHHGNKDYHESVVRHIFTTERSAAQQSRKWLQKLARDAACCQVK